MSSEYPLLPSDRYIADLLGLTEEQYRYYQAEVRRRAAEGPQPSVTATIGADFFLYVAVISSLLSVGFTIAAAFFRPRISNQQPQLRQNQVQGRITTDIRRYAPRQGFDALQDIAAIGDPIPLVYAKREQIDGQYYGGIRINTPMIWSQIQSINKSQLLRAVFLIGEGEIGQIDPGNIAIGNNTLGTYLLGNSSNARFSVYYRSNGGRLTSDDHIAGASPGNDPGNISDSNVFGILNANDQLSSNFCHTRRPNTQTSFGVYAMIGNGLGFRVNPSLRPGVNAQLTVDVESAGGKKGGSGKAYGRVVCELDYVAMAQRAKFSAKFSGRSGLIATSGNTWTYRLSNTSDILTTFELEASSLEWRGRRREINMPLPGSDDAYRALISFGPITTSGRTVSGTVYFDTGAAQSMFSTAAPGTYVITYYVWFESDTGKQIGFDHKVTMVVTETTIANPVPPGGSSVVKSFSFSNTTATYSGTFSKNSDHSEKSGDVAASVAGRQKTWDDAILVGELYKIGSALAICTNRAPSDEAFNSDADFEPPGGGTAIDATFEVIRDGTCSTIPAADLEKDAKSNPPFYTATNQPHLFRVAIATFATVRECRVVEVGIRSSLGIRISGLCDFRDTLTLEQIDEKACLSKKGDKIDPGDSLAVDIFNSGQMSSSEERYSFFRISYREAGTENDFTQLPQCYGIRGITQQNVFNSIRFAMPTSKRWEFQFEPLSGWEIRSGIAGGDLELIDSSLSTVRSIQIGSMRVSFNGVTNGGNAPFIAEGSRASVGPQTFMLASVQRPDEIGIGYADGDSYVDSWGKLGEAFVYEEVRSSAESGPEHEIVYINEIIPNASVPEYDNLAIVGLNMRAGVEWQQLGQLSVYVLSGINNTHLFPEVLRDLLTNSRYGKGDQISAQQIDEASFSAAAAWCQARRYFFDGAIVGKTNLRQWAADVAATHLLFFGESEGRFWLKPAWPYGGGSSTDPQPVSIKGIFTAGNIEEGSFLMEFFDAEDRQTIQVSVKYREERMSSNFDNPGLFSFERELLVREVSPNGSDTDPIESIDISDYATSRSHAVDAAKFVIRMRRIPDHMVKFKTTHEGLVAAIEPGDYIRVVMDVTHYDQLRNGAVLGDGSLVSTQPFTDGTYSVLAWDGSSSSSPGTTTLTVTGNGSQASPTGVIFTLVNSETQARTYQIEKITPAQDGSGFEIEAIHMPTDASGYLLLAQNWGGDTSDANWIIEG